MPGRRAAALAALAVLLSGCAVVEAVPGCHMVAPAAGPMAPLAFGACFAATTGRTIHTMAEEARAQEAAQAAYDAERGTQAANEAGTSSQAPADATGAVTVADNAWGVDKSDH